VSGECLMQSGRLALPNGSRSQSPLFRCSVTGYQPGLQETVIDRMVNEHFGKDRCC